MGYTYFVWGICISYENFAFDVFRMGFVWDLCVDLCVWGGIHMPSKRVENWSSGLSESFSTRSDPVRE